jgi:hypothetical protein
MWSYLLSVLLWRRVVIRTKSGNKIVCKRPKDKPCRVYRDDFMRWMVADRGEPLKFGGKRQQVAVYAREIDTVEVY